MRLTSKDLEAGFGLDFAVGWSTPVEIDLALDNDEAIIVKTVRFQLGIAGGAAAPSVTGAGLTAFQYAIYSRDQVIPAEFHQLDRALAVGGFTEGSLAAGPIQIVEGPADVLLPGALTRYLAVVAYTTNVTNAATADLQGRIVYDRYTITSAEKVLLL